MEGNKMTDATKESYIRVIDIVDDTTVDGPGFRISIYCAGCKNHCPGCHNPETWDEQAGRDVLVSELFDHIISDEFANVTFSGGDPFLHPDGFAALAKRIKKETKKTIWCYTGYLFENLTKRPEARELLEHLDVLVDGPFHEEEKDDDLFFRGSRNQRLIDVQASLRAGSVVLFDYNPLKGLK